MTNRNALSHVRERSTISGRTTLSESERLRESDQDKAGYCRHDKCILKQGVNKNTGKVWRGEFCRAGVCEPTWWRWHEQIGVWISPMYEPNDYLYVGWKERAEERNDPPE